MTAKELTEKLSLEILSIPDPDREITGGYTGDLLSWVMGRAKEGDAWVTIMSNQNTVAVATLADVACVILAEQSEADAALITLAENKGINLFRSAMSAFALSAEIGALLKA